MAADSVENNQRYSPRLLRVAILSTVQAKRDPSYAAADAVVECLCQVGNQFSPFEPLEAALSQTRHLMFAVFCKFSILPTARTLQQSRDPHD